MARDSRLGTWQVLLTISLVITPLSAHGKSSADPTLCVCRLCMCTVCVCMYQRVLHASAHVHKSNHTCIGMALTWKISNDTLDPCNIGSLQCK